MPEYSWPMLNSALAVAASATASPEMNDGSENKAWLAPACFWLLFHITAPMMAAMTPTTTAPATTRFRFVRSQP